MNNNEIKEKDQSKETLVYLIGKNLPNILLIIILLLFAVIFITNQSNYFKDKIDRNNLNIEEVTEIFEIYSLNPQGQTKRDFILKTGNIGEDVFYRYYIKNEKGAYLPEFIKPESVSIFIIGKDEQPLATVTRKIKKGSITGEIHEETVSMLRLDIPENSIEIDISSE